MAALRPHAALAGRARRPGRTGHAARAGQGTPPGPALASATWAPHALRPWPAPYEAPQLGPARAGALRRPAHALRHTGRRRRGRQPVVLLDAVARVQAAQRARRPPVGPPEQPHG